MENLNRAIQMRKIITDEIHTIKHSQASHSSIIRLYDLLEQNQRLEDLVLNQFGFYGWQVVFGNKKFFSL